MNTKTLAIFIEDNYSSTYKCTSVEKNDTLIRSL